MPSRYTVASVIMVKPNPLRAKDVDVAKQAEAAKVRLTRLRRAV